jgi:hypothetical protein
MGLSNDGPCDTAQHPRNGPFNRFWLWFNNPKALFEFL